MLPHVIPSEVSFERQNLSIRLIVGLPFAHRRQSTSVASCLHNICLCVAGTSCLVEILTTAFLIGSHSEHKRDDLGDSPGLAPFVPTGARAVRLSLSKSLWVGYGTCRQEK
jgi:hypothetical protein